MLGRLENIRPLCIVKIEGSWLKCGVNIRADQGDVVHVMGNVGQHLGNFDSRLPVPGEFKRETA